MTALWIILGVLAAVIAIIVILLHFSIKAYVTADKKSLSVTVKYLGIKVYGINLPDSGKTEDEPVKDDSDDGDGEDIPEYVLEEIKEADSEPFEITESPPNPPDASEPEKADSEPPSEEVKKTETEEDDEKSDEPKPTLLQQFNEYKKYIPAGKKAFRKLLKLIRFYDLKLSLTAGNDDPYKAGLNFGRINAAVYSLLGLICSIFSVKIDSTEIKCDYEHKVFDVYFSTAIYVRPSAVVALAAYLGVYYLKIKRSMKKLKKTAKENVNNEREEHQS